MQSISTLRRLASIITDSVDSMERVYASSGMPLPSLDEPFNQHDPGEALRQDPEVSNAVKNIMAAAAQISATVCDPMRLVVDTSRAFHLSSCLLVASNLDVVEILREAGPKGVTAEDIVAHSHVNPNLIARILRLLATHHIFREVSPGVFANNRISSTLDKGKSSSVLNSNRADRFIGSSGIAALVEQSADIGGKSGVYLADSVVNPDGVLPFNLAYRTEEDFFAWLHQAENSYNTPRFGVAMQGTAATEPSDLIFRGFDWGLLPQNETIVDVGGGIGHVSLTIAKKYPHLRIVMQDLARSIELSKGYWGDNFPEHISKQMPIKDAAVFLLRYVLHNWSDNQAQVMLRHLRAAALPTTRLVILEKIVPFASVEDSEASRTKDIAGAFRPSAKYPLLPNWGPATADLYLYDLTMHVLLGGVERTLEGFWDLLEPSGWKLVEVHHCAGSQLSHLVAIPV
ncbi:hypothetical protein MVEN_00718600 [Mycena venus]|uniref:S-adenosyl-L-methionine-dependent methyltransferase n=1 Tax=Mycena venus TaxID=2733690 RepID=A0A8H6YJN5_9AGAR|nr:hypothetical protein MVEN_00718600 [Mycena venus]